MNYTVSFITYTNYNIEADNEDEAIDIAEQLYTGYYDEVEIWGII